MRCNKLVRLLGVGLLLGLYACGTAEEEQASARVGELGNVKYTGGGGATAPRPWPWAARRAWGWRQPMEPGPFPPGSRRPQPGLR